MPRKLCGIFALGVLGALVAVPRAGADEITLRQAMEQARSQAREVAAASSRLTARQAQVDEAKAHRWPKVSLQEVWMRTDSPAEAFALQLNQERFSFNDFVSSDPNHPDAIENGMTRLEVSVPLYTGGELASRIAQAKGAAAAAEKTATWAADGAAMAAAEAWVQLSQAREQVTLLEHSLETMDAHVALAKAYVDQGMIVTSELLRAKVERSRVADYLATARAQSKVAESNLSFRLAADLASHWQLAPLPEPQPLADDLAAWLASAEQRADLVAARKMLGVARLETEVKKAARLPHFALMARYDLFDDHPFGSHGDSSAVMAMGSIDLFAGGAHRASIAAAEANAAAAASDVDRFAEGVRLAVENAWSEATSARERHATAAAALQSAKETERITEQRFRQGVVKMIDLIDASTARREAETRELTSRAEAHLAGLKLALAAGRAPETMIVEKAP